MAVMDITIKSIVAEEDRLYDAIALISGAQGMLDIDDQNNLWRVLEVARKLIENVASNLDDIECGLMYPKEPEKSSDEQNHDSVKTMDCDHA